MPSAGLSALSRLAIAGALIAGALLPGLALAQQPSAADFLPPRPVPGLSTPAAPVTPPPAVSAPQAAPAPIEAQEEKAASEEALRAAEAEAPEDALRAAACKTHAMVKLKARAPSVDDIFIDMDGLTIAKADVMVGSEKITAVLMGEAYIKHDHSDKAHRFLCLVGEEDKVVMTFFTER